MECLADIIWTASRHRPHSNTHTHTHTHTLEIDHNLLCQPHNKTISELNEAGEGEVYSWEKRGGSKDIEHKHLFSGGGFGVGQMAS